MKNKNIYHDMAEHANDYDFSEYPSDHPLFSIKNKKVIGKFNDELNSLTMEEFAGVLPKCYSILYLGEVKDNQIQNLEGTKEAVKKQYLKHVHFINVLTNLSTLVVKQNVIRSKVHTISTNHQKRTALTTFGTKRCICDDNIRTLAHGHFRIYEHENRDAIIIIIIVFKYIIIPCKHGLDCSCSGRSPLSMILGNLLSESFYM